MSAIISSINWLDILFLSILLGMIYKGSHTGVGSQLLSLAWWFVLIFFSIGYYSVLSSRIFGFMVQNWARAICFFIIVAVMVLIIKFLESIFNIAVTENLAPIERVGGAFIAFLRAFLLFGLIGIQLLLLPFDFLRDPVVEGSATCMFFVRTDSGIYSWIAGHLAFVEDRKSEEVVKEFLASAGKKDE